MTPPTHQFPAICFDMLDIASYETKKHRYLVGGIMIPPYKNF